MLKRITIILLGFAAGVMGNLIAGYVQQDLWSNVFTQERLFVTAGSILLMLLLVASLETERALAWNWRWHRFWYLRELLKNPELRHWESDFARLEMVQGKRARISSAEVLAGGNRKDMIEVLRELIVERDGKNSRALVLGEPGSGKTTGLERLTLDLARAGKRRLGIGCKMPVLVRLGDFQEGKLVDHIAQTMRHGARHSSGKVLSKGIEMLLEQGQLVLLCDALDEALGARRDSVIAELKVLLTSQAYQNVPIIITSRTREDPGEALKGLTVFEIQDLNDEAVNAFVPAYKQPEHSEAEITQRLHAHRLLEPGGLGRNPFWLRLIIASGAFEGNKGQILNAAVDTLLAREWDEKPRVERSWQRVLPRGEQLEETKRSLAFLGYWMSTGNMVAIEQEGVLTAFEKGWLAMRQQAGVKGLRPQDVLGLGRDAQILVYEPRLVRFRHRLLQEFMTAWMLKEFPLLLEQELEKIDQDAQRWPTFFLLGDLFNDQERFVLQVLGDGESFTRALLAFGFLEIFAQAKQQPVEESKLVLHNLMSFKAFIPEQECKQKWQALLLRVSSCSEVELQVTNAFVHVLLADFNTRQKQICQELFQIIGEGLADRLTSLLVYENYACHVKVIELLQIIGSKKAGEGLVLALGDKKLREDARRALIQLGAPAIAPLVEALRWEQKVEFSEFEAISEERSLIGQEGLRKQAESVELLEIFGDKKTAEAARTNLQITKEWLENSEAAYKRTVDWIQKATPPFQNITGLLEESHQEIVHAFEEAGMPEVAQALVKNFEIEKWLSARVPESQYIIDILSQIGEPTVGYLIKAMEPKGFLYMSGAKRAARVLGKIASAQAIDALVNKLDELSIFTDVGKILRAIGAPAVPALLRVLDSENLLQRVMAIFVLRDLGQQMVTPLLEALRDRRLNLNTSWVADILPANLETVDALIAALEDKNADLHLMAGYVIEKIGEPAIDKLLAALNEGKLSWSNANVLGRVGISALGYLRENLSHPNANVRRGVAHAFSSFIQRYPITDDETIQALVLALKDPDSTVTLSAGHALAWIGSPAVEPVSRLLLEEDAITRWSALQCFLMMNMFHAVDLTNELLPIIHDPFPPIRLFAIDILGRAGNRRALGPLIRKFFTAFKKTSQQSRQTQSAILKACIKIILKPIFNFKMTENRRKGEWITKRNLKAKTALSMEIESKTS